MMEKLPVEESIKQSERESEKLKNIISWWLHFLPTGEVRWRAEMFWWNFIIVINQPFVLPNLGDNDRITSSTPENKTKVMEMVGLIGSGKLRDIFNLVITTSRQFISRAIFNSFPKYQKLLTVENHHLARMSIFLLAADLSGGGGEFTKFQILTTTTDASSLWRWSS